MSLEQDASGTAFAILAEAQAADRMQIRETEVAVAAGLVLHAMDGGTRVLLIPLKTEEATQLDEESRGVVLRPRDWLDEGVRRRFQTVVCEMPALNVPFESLCDEILQALDEAPTNPARRCLEVLERWRDLLGPRASRLLGENALIGLLAELHLLEALVQVAPPADALGRWMGPTGSRFDFVGGSAVVEVKATTSRDQFSVTIHGLLQLDPPDGSALLLYAEQMERVPVGGDSVPDAVERLVASGVSRRDLLGLLAALGYLAADMDDYRTVRFRELDVRAFEIVVGFPRLVRSGLVDPGMADRVNNVSYSVDLSDVLLLPGHLPDVAEVTRRLMIP